MAAARAVAQPTISSLSTLTGIPGSSVTITGTNFNATAANDVVYFGATRATVTSASATSLTVTVPVGAEFDQVTVDNLSLGLTAYSDHQFVPTYDNGAYMPDTVNFDSRVVFAADINPEAVSISDIDGDGKPDMVVLHEYTGKISVYLNTSTAGSITAGSFAAPIDVVYNAAGAPVTFAVGDIDGDGHPDLAIVGFDSGVVLRNTSSAGAISFASPVSFGSFIDGANIAIGDIDGDGKPDLAVAHFGTSVSLFHNTSSIGAIVFEPEVTFAGNYATLALGDIDGDGKLDIVVSSSNDSIFIYRNTSSAGSIMTSSFAAPVIMIAAGGSPAIGDLDGDGKPDLALCSDSSVLVFRNTSVAGSVSFVAPIAFSTEQSAAAITIGDIDGDGKPDLAVMTYHSVSFLRNTAISGSITATSFVNYTSPLPVAIDAIAMGDLDGDGKPDVTVVSTDDYTVSVLRNHPLPTTETPGMAGSNSFEVNMIPNPNNGSFAINGKAGSIMDERITLEITNMLGQVVYSNTGRATGGVINEQILLSSSLANGMYLLNVKRGDESKTLHFVIEK